MLYTKNVADQMTQRNRGSSEYTEEEQVKVWRAHALRTAAGPQQAKTQTQRHFAESHLVYSLICITEK